jgi:hypothetical protein
MAKYYSKGGFFRRGKLETEKNYKDGQCLSEICYDKREGKFNVSI